VSLRVSDESGADNQREREEFLFHDFKGSMV
jgi:hypothetical protein